MGKKRKRELIDWFPVTPPQRDWNDWQHTPHKNKILEMLNNPMNHRATGWLIDIMADLIRVADHGDRHHSRESVVRSLRYVALDFYYLEGLMNNCIPVLPKKKDFYMLLQKVERLESVGFELPKLKNRLLKVRLIRDFS